VPRVLERIQAGIDAKVKGKGLLTRLIFGLAFRWKQFRIHMGSPVESASPWLDSVVFDSVRKGFGGRLRFVVSGGAPLARRVQDYLQIALCCPVLQGYGLTETCAASFFTHPPPMRHAGTVGPPLPATEFRFQAAKEMGYSPTASPPRGEICIRGPMVFAGYFKMEDKTKESFDKDGFFHTGDIGELTPEGGLRIIDRMKNIFKLAQGEYIAVEKLETDYGDTDIVDQIWVYGNSFENVLVAVVVPDKKKLESWASSNGASGSFEELCKNPKAADFVTAELGKTQKAKRLKGFEAVRGVILETDAFTVDNDLMTPSMKLKRPQLQKKYQKQIDALYKKLNKK
jgi:long-chain acyl-CoA synthetase